MEDPKAYQEIINMQSRDLKDILNEFPFEWKQNARIMDIGCGDGSGLMNIWKKYMPENFMNIVGSDKSEACVNFAKNNYETKIIQFVTLDIEGKVPCELKGCFDHVISNYTFHWVQHQQKGFSNIHDMLSKDGSCLIIFLGYVDVYENYRTLSRTAKWSADLENVEKMFMSPYHDSQDPEAEIISLMRTVGFRDINVQVLNKRFDFVRGIQEFRDMMKCLNPFEGLKDKWEDFMDDYVNLYPDAGKMMYQLLVVSGKK